MLKQYFKQAWNLMRQEKLFSAIYIIGTGLAVSMVMTLAIALTAMLTDVYPETNRDRMLIVDFGMIEDKIDQNQHLSSLSTKAIHRCFDGMGDVETMSVAVTWNEQGKVQLDRDRQVTANIKFVDNNFWKVFSFDFIKGKPFTASDLDARKRVAVISESLAQKTFGSADVVGKDISFDFIKYRVAGVVKDASAITNMSYSDIWVPYSFYPYIDQDGKDEATGTLGSFSAYLLVKEGADIKAVKREGQQRIDRYSQSLGKDVRFWCMERPYTHKENFFSQRSVFPVNYTNVVILALLIILVLLIIPAVNLSGMTDSRMERRLAELGVRRSFGASRSSLIKQIITENLLFTILGGIVGLVISYILLFVCKDLVFNLLNKYVSEGGNITYTSGMLFNPWVFVIILAVCFVLNLCSALIPAWKASRHPITESLRPLTGATMTEGKGMSFFSRVKKNAWIGIELMLVFGLMWLITDKLSVMGLYHNLPAHMNTDRVWNIEMGTLPETHSDYDGKADSLDRKLADYEMVIKTIAEYKDIEQSAALVPYGMPFSGSNYGISILNPRDTSNIVNVNVIHIYPKTDYFRTFAYTDPEGNPVSMKEFNFDDPGNIVISQRIADYFFPDGNAVGKTIESNSWRGENKKFHVVGVVGNVKRTDYERPENNIYVKDDITFGKYQRNIVAVRLKPGVSEKDFADEFMAEMSRKLRIGNFYVKDIQSYDSIRNELNRGFGYTIAMTFGKIMSAFFLINILLCVMGTFWYRVSMRREEIGVRMAMGADKKKIRNMLFKEGLVLLSIAAVPAIAIELVLVITDIVSYGLPPRLLYPELIFDYPAARFIITNIMTWLILALVIVLAIWIPASRAVKLSPADAIQDE